MSLCCGDDPATEDPDEHAAKPSTDTMKKTPALIGIDIRPARVLGMLSRRHLPA